MLRDSLKMAILAAVLAVDAGQPVHGGGFQGSGAAAIEIAHRHEDFERLVFHGLAAEREERFEDVIRLFPGGREARQLTIVFSLGMVDEQIPPNLQAAGDMRLAIGVQAQPRGQQHHVRIGAETGRAGPGVVMRAADRGVEAFHAHRVRQVVLNRAMNAGQGVVETGQPAIVAGHELVKKSTPLSGEAPASSVQAATECWPPGTTALPPRISNIPPKKSRTWANTFKRLQGSPLRRLGGFGIELGEARDRGGRWRGRR